MILKVQTLNSYAVESWRFFEGCRDIHYSKMNVDQYKEFVEVDFTAPKPKDIQTIYFGDFDNIIEPPQAPCIAFISFNGDSTGPTEIHCCTSVYLLDDNGKTIEKLI